MSAAMASPSRCCACAASASATATASPCRTRASTSGPARCWPSSASRAPASPPCSTAVGGARQARCRQRAVPDAAAAGLREVFAMSEARAAPAGAHRLGLRPPERGRGPAHGRLGRRQRRRAADGPGRAPLRPPARHRFGMAGARRDRSGAHRRRAAHLLRRHAPAAADRAQPGHAPAPGASWTSRPRGSTFRCRRACWTCCASSRARCSWPPSWSRTTSPWRGCSRTA